MSGNRNDPASRRAQQNKRYQKKSYSALTQDSPPSSPRSQASDETTSSLISRTRTQTRRHKPAVMPLAKALRILGLSGHPFHTDIRKAGNAKLEAPELKDNVSRKKYQDTVEAIGRLNHHQSSLLNLFQKEFEKTCRSASDKLGKLQVRAQQEHHDIPDLCGELEELGLQFFRDLRGLDVDIHRLQNEYYKRYRHICDTANDVSVSPDIKQGLVQLVQALFVDLEKRPLRLPLEEDSFKDLDPISSFKEEYAAYLSTILELKRKHTQHDHIFDDLHDLMTKLGDRFCEEIEKPGADLNYWSKAYAHQFNQITSKAKLALGKESGIWANLHPILQQLATVIYVIKLIIAEFETPEDRLRMFNPDKKSIAEDWEQWQMDTMPVLDVKKIPAHK